MTVVDRVRSTRTFLEESWGELQKVTWPDRDQLQNATLVVLGFTVAISLVIWGMDAIIRVLLQWIMSIFGA